MKTKNQASADPGLRFAKDKQTGRKVYSEDEKSNMYKIEAELQTKCEEWLLRQGWVKPGAIAEAASTQIIRGIFIHVPNQAFQSKRRTVVGAYLKNLPDLILFHPDGRYFSVELKSKTGERRRGQRAVGNIMQVREEKTFEVFKESVLEWYNFNNYDDTNGGNNVEH